MTCNPRERGSPKKEMLLGPRQRAFQEMKQAFPFLLCNPLEARVADHFWTELARVPGVLDLSWGGVSLERNKCTSSDQCERGSKKQILILNLKLGTLATCVCSCSPLPPTRLSFIGQVSHLTHLCPCSFQPRARH